MNVLNQVLVFLGSALMVYNIVGFVRFARYVRTLNAKKSISSSLVLPIVLLVLFLSLIQQVWVFVSTIYTELFYRART